MNNLGQTHRIVRPQPESLRSVWPGEATHFTPWLADNLDWLDELGLGPLERRGTEVRLPDVGRNLDILAATIDGRLVAIENQYLKVDHDHLTRGLAYARGLDATALVVIAEDHAAEFVDIADYLNEAYEQLGDRNGIAVFLVKVTVESVGESFVPRFSVVSRPNAWRSAVREEADLGPSTVTMFLDSCAPEARSDAEEIVRDWSLIAEASMRVNPRAAASVSLDIPYGVGSEARSVYVLYPTGLLTVNRGYLVEYGPFDDTEHDELDAAIARHFPGISQKPYYPSAAKPNPESVVAFAQWVASKRSARTAERSGA